MDKKVVVTNENDFKKRYADDFVPFVRSTSLKELRHSMVSSEVSRISAITHGLINDGMSLLL